MKALRFLPLLTAALSPLLAQAIPPPRPTPEAAPKATAPAPTAASAEADTPGKKPTPTLTRKPPAPAPTAKPTSQATAARAPEILKKAVKPVAHGEAKTAAKVKKGAAPAVEPTDFLRYYEDEARESDYLQTASVRYLSPTGVTVDLVGAVHIADKAYFKALNAQFKKYDAVLYELVGRPMDLRGDDPKTGDGSGKLQWLGQAQEMMRKHLKLESQLKGIDYKAKNFVHADMSVEGFFESQEEKKESFLTLWFKAMQAQSALPADRPQPSMLELVMILRQDDPSIALKRLVGEEFDSMEQLITGMEANGGTTIIGERNRHAMEVMQREIQAGKKRLAIFYGAAHLPDMEQRLLKMGFKLQQKAWVDAWEVPWDEE